MHKLRIILGTVLVAASTLTYAQTQDFRTSTALEIEHAILKELMTGYVDSVKTDEIINSGIEAMLYRLDPYTIYIPQEDAENFEMMMMGTYGGIGAIIYKRPGEGVIINEPYYGSPAVNSGLQSGDTILEIDGEPVFDLESTECSNRMKGKPGTTVNFKVKKVRTGDTINVSIKRQKIHIPDIEYSGMLDDSTGYIRLTGFTDGNADIIRSDISAMKENGMKRLVFDLRGNGGGSMKEAIDILSAFLPKGTMVVSSKGKNKLMCTEYRTTLNPVDTELPLLVLIDGGSASASEIVAGAVQDLDRGLVMGVRSFGKGLVQTVRPLPYDAQLKMTTARYYTPSGRCVQALDYSNRKEDGSVGYVPDSLRNEFKTAKGRIVKDGGGITPDVEIEVQQYSRTIYSLVLNGIIDQYTLDFVSRTDSVPEDFYLSDEEFEKFVEFAADKDVDYRSNSTAIIDKLKDALKEEGLDELTREEMTKLEESLNIDNKTLLRHLKDEIVPFLEEEIVTRYHFHKAGVKVRLRTDRQLKEAIQKWDESLQLIS